MAGFFAALSAAWAAIQPILQVAALVYYAVKALTGGESPAYSNNCKVTQCDPTLPRAIIYGRHRYAGNIIYQRFSDDKKWQYLIVAFGVGPIEAFEDVRVNDIPIGDLPGCSYTAYLGTATQGVDPIVIGGAATVGSLKYLAYLAVTLKVSDQIANGVPNITAIVKGRKVQVWNGSSWVLQWSDNPIWCTLDLMRDPVNGAGYSDDMIDFPSAIEAAQYCDDLLPDGKPRFSLNVVIDWREPFIDVFNRLRMNFRGYAVLRQGKLAIKVLRPDTSAQSFTVGRDIIRESMQVKLPSVDEEYDVVRCWYTDPSVDWSRQYAEYRGREVLNPRILEIQLYGTTDRARASMMARFYWRLYNECGVVGQFKTSVLAADRTPGDVIDITWPKFRTIWSRTPVWAEVIRTDDRHNVEITFRRYADIFDDAEGSGETGATPGVLPNPWAAPPDPTNLTVSETRFINADGTWTIGIDVSFTPPAFVWYERAQILLSRDGGTTWEHIAYTTSNTYRIAPLPVKDLNGNIINYRVMVKSVNSVQGNSLCSPGMVSGIINLTGDVTPPAKPVGVVAKSIPRGVSVDFARPGDADWAVSKIYLSTTSGFTPNDQTNLADYGKKLHFEVVDSICLGPLTPNTTYYVKVVHVDTSGNASEPSDEVEVIAGQYQGTDLAPATVPYGALDILTAELLKAVVADPCVLSGWKLGNVELIAQTEKDQGWIHTPRRIISNVVISNLYQQQKLSAIKFDLTGISGTVEEAELILFATYMQYVSGLSNGIKIYKITSDFIEDSLDIPATETTPLFTAPPPQQINTKYSIKDSALTSLVQSWLNNPSTNYGIMLKEIDGQAEYRFADRHDTNINKRPVLKLKMASLGTLLAPITAGSGYIDNKIIGTNELKTVDLNGHPDGTYFMQIIYDYNLNALIEHAPYVILSSDAPAGQGYIYVPMGSIPLDAVGKTIQVGNQADERHKIAVAVGDVITFDGTKLKYAHSAGEVASLIDRPKYGMNLGAVTKSGTTLTYDMSPRTGRKDLALSFAKFGVTDANNGSDPPGGHIWISPWTYVTNNNYYDFTHNLDSYDTLITIEFKDTTQNIIRVATDADEIYTSQYWRRGTSAQKISKNVVRVYTGQNSVQIEVKVGGVQEFTSGYLRVIVQKIK